MNFSCGDCMDVWNCSWCKNRFCDDVCCPFVLEGKPIYNTMSDVHSGLFYQNDTEKERRKKIRKFLNTPLENQFFLCKKCRAKYIENNVRKGRHKYVI